MNYDYYEMVFGMIMIASQTQLPLKLHFNANGCIASTEFRQKKRKKTTKKPKIKHTKIRARNSFVRYVDGFMTVRSSIIISAMKCFSVALIE